MGSRILRHALSTNWAKHSHLESLEKVDEVTLRYQVHLGDVIFVADGVDFSAGWGWVHVLDFVAGLNHVIIELSEGKLQCSIDFTESTAEIMFNRTHDSILITSNYASGQAIAQFEDLIRVTAESRCMEEFLTFRFMGSMEL